MSQGSDITSANNLSLEGSSYDGNLYNITGNTTINLIDSTQWSNGSIIYLRYYPLILKRGLDYTTSAGNILSFILVNSAWYEVNDITPNFTTYYSSSITTSATPTPTGNFKENELYITALTQNTVLQQPSGTPVNGNGLFIRIYGASSYTFGLNSIFRDITTNVPANTVAGKEMFMYAVYNSRAVKWDILAYKEES